MSSELTPAEALTVAADRLREEGAFRFEASFTRTKHTAPDDVEQYATAEGAVDLEAGRARASFELAPLFPGQENPTPLDGPFELLWDDETVTIEVDGHTEQLARLAARESGGRGLVRRFARSRCLHRQVPVALAAAESRRSQ